MKEVNLNGGTIVNLIFRRVIIKCLVLGLKENARGHPIITYCEHAKYQYLHLFSVNTFSVTP